MEICTVQNEYHLISIKKVSLIKQKYTKADYPYRFINSVINQFNQKNIETTEGDMLIPQDFFKIPKETVFVEIPYCPGNEKSSKRFIQKLNEFPKHNYDVRIKCVTKKVKTLFRVKDKNQYPSCII